MNRAILADAQWEIVQQVLQAPPRVSVGRPEHCRRFVNGVLWVLRSGAQWRLLLPEWGTWNSVFKRFHRWSQWGMWETLHAQVAADPDWQHVLIDSTGVRAHAQRPRGARQQRRGRGTGSLAGRLWHHDSRPDRCLGLSADLPPRPRPGLDIGQAHAPLPDHDTGALLADKGYDADGLLQSLEARGIQAVIPPRAHRTVQRVCDWHLYKERHLIERFFGKIKHYRRIFSRFDTTARNYKSFLHRVAALIWMR